MATKSDVKVSDNKRSQVLSKQNLNDSTEMDKNLKEYEKMLDDMKSSFWEKWKMRDKQLNDYNDVGVDDFEKFRTLGTGAFGRVVLVKYRSTSTYYAMKILEKRRIVETKQIEHTYNEKKVLQCVKFPFLVRMEFFFKDNSYLYIILPFISGGEMFTHLRRMGRFDEDLAKFYAAQVTLALEYLHHCGLVYRDLKPENILIDKTGYLKITDFGFCKMIETRTWTLCGTPEYLAPELILSKGYGKSVDWWSFGILVYEMNAGYPPFHAHDPIKIYEKIVAGKFKYANHFANELRDIIGNLLQVDLTRRYGNLKDGTNDIKRHKWFATIDWKRIYDRTIKPSFVPEQSRHPGDTGNFDNYDEQSFDILSTDRYVNEFTNF